MKKSTTFVIGFIFGLMLIGLGYKLHDLHNDHQVKNNAISTVSTLCKYSSGEETWNGISANLRGYYTKYLNLTEEASFSDACKAVSRELSIIVETDLSSNCGAAIGVTFTTKPSAFLCLAGTASEVSDTGTWSCTGADGSIFYCSADILATSTVN